MHRTGAVRSAARRHNRQPIGLARLCRDPGVRGSIRHRRSLRQMLLIPGQRFRRARQAWCPPLAEPPREPAFTRSVAAIDLGYGFTGRVAPHDVELIGEDSFARRLHQFPSTSHDGTPRFLMWPRPAVAVRLFQPGGGLGGIQKRLQHKRHGVLIARWAFSSDTTTTFAGSCLPNATQSWARWNRPPPATTKTAVVIACCPFMISLSWSAGLVVSGPALPGPDTRFRLSYRP